MDYPSGLDDFVNFVIKEYTKDDTPRSPAKFWILCACGVLYWWEEQGTRKRQPRDKQKQAESMGGRTG